MLYRGDIVWVADAKVTGSEQKGMRPALIVSNDKGNEHSPVITVVWLTSADKKPMPTHCTVKATEKSTALCEQLVTISKERVLDYIRSATAKEMADVNRCIVTALALPQEQSGNVKDTVGDIIAEIDELFYNESDGTIAEGIDRAGSVVRQMYRRMCMEGDTYE